MVEIAFRIGAFLLSVLVLLFEERDATVRCQIRLECQYFDIGAILTFLLWDACRIRQRDAARKRFEEKKRGPRDDRMAETNERVTAIREKDKATMDMFMQMAKARYG